MHVRTRVYTQRLGKRCPDEPGSCGWSRAAALRDARRDAEKLYKKDITCHVTHEFCLLRHGRRVRFALSCMRQRYRVAVRNARFLHLLVLFGVFVVSLAILYASSSTQLDAGKQDTRSAVAEAARAQERLVRLYRKALSLDDPTHCTFIIGVGLQPRGQDLRGLFQHFGAGRWFRKPRVYYYGGLSADALRLAHGARRRASRSDILFSRPERDGAIDGVIGCAVSHLLAVRSALQRGCKTALFLEDDTSLGLVRYWDKPVAAAIHDYASDEYPVLQMELKLRSFLERGDSGALGLEHLPVRCGWRHTVPHRFKVTYGTGAYGMLRTGMERTLQRFTANEAFAGRARASHLGPVDVSKVIAAGGHADVYVILNATTTKVLWPPYFHEAFDSKSIVRPREGRGNSHQPQHIASARYAIKANMRWAEACREYVLENE